MPGRDANPNDDGIIVIDKPENMSSARVVARVKALLGAKKAGHTGTLDPFATGVLVCCINRATRLARFFLHGDKGYTATLKLGVETDTQDATGAVTATHSVAEFTTEQLMGVMGTFKGWIDQVPPAYSALKHQGVPLYKLARKGLHVKKPARRVRISNMTVLEIDLPHIRFDVRCSAGTYIRTLCADMGKELGCGGHLTALHRTFSSGFRTDDALSLPELERRCKNGNVSDRLIGMADALKDMRTAVVGGHLAGKIAHGIVLTQNDLVDNVWAEPGEYIKIVNEAQALLAVVQQKKENKRYDYCCVFQ